MQVESAWEFPRTGKFYILIFNKALCIPIITHILVDTNQLRKFRMVIQDNTSSIYPLHICNSDDKFAMNLEIQGTNIYANTFTSPKK